MVGIPDGLGATDGPHGRDFTLFMNQELPATAGRAAAGTASNGRVRLAVGEIDSQSLEVEEGQDLIDPGVRYWNYAAHQYSIDAAHAARTGGAVRPLLLRVPVGAGPARQHEERPRLRRTDLLRATRRTATTAATSV